MIFSKILRLSVVIGMLCALVCLVGIVLGSHIQTTHVVAYVYDMREQRRFFALYDLSRRLYTLTRVPIESNWQVLFSPNGRRALMLLDFYQQVEFRIMNLQTRQQITFPLGYNVCAPPLDSIHWLPDNRSIIFQCSPNTLRSHTNGVHVWDTETNTVRRVYEPDGLNFVTYQWTQDNRLLAVLDSGTIWLIDLQTDARHSLSSRRYGSMQWSPNGDTLALTSTGQAYLYDLTTQALSPILENHLVHQIYWSPDSQWLAVRVSEEGMYVAYTFHIPTATVYRIRTRDSYAIQVVNVQWSDNSTYLILEMDTNRANSVNIIFVANREGNLVYQITSDGRTPRWIPNQSELTYNNPPGDRSRYGRDLIHVMLNNFQPSAMTYTTLVQNAIVHRWYDNMLLILSSPDRSGFTRWLYAYPTIGEAGFSLLPQQFNVDSFSVLR